MAEMQTCNGSSQPYSWADRGIDCIVTLICWAWFIFGFILFFSWLYLISALVVKDPELTFQRLNSRFYQIFFRIVRVTAPRQRIEIDKKVAAIRSSVIICNHLSYLDPLLLIALFQQQRTIVKTRFFSMPIFGWIIKKSGYFPATSEGPFAQMMIRQMETMGPYLQGGGNLFVFPEGTRSRDGKLGILNKGAFKIARICRAPIYVLEICNTDKLFTPGKFLFNTRMKNNISVKIIDCIEPDYQQNPPSLAELELRVRQAYRERQK
jgi:1-acyl-sn-glycerol-3-phosphate acyltransferase